MCRGIPVDTECRPETELSKLIAKETGARIEPHTISLFLRLHWTDVAKWAHAIHEGKGSPFEERLKGDMAREEAFNTAINGGPLPNTDGRN